MLQFVQNKYRHEDKWQFQNAVHHTKLCQSPFWELLPLSRDLWQTFHANETEVLSKCMWRGLHF